MQRVHRCWKILTDSNRCVLNSRRFATCIKRASSGLYSAIGHEPTLNTGTCVSRRRSLPVLQCSNLAQDSRLRRIGRTIPEEIWAILIAGKIRVCCALQYNMCPHTWLTTVPTGRISSLSNSRTVLKTSILPTEGFFSLRPSSHPSGNSV